MDTGLVAINNRLHTVCLLTTRDLGMSMMDGEYIDQLDGYLVYYKTDGDGHIHDIVIRADYDGHTYWLPAHSGPSQMSFRTFLRHTIGIGARVTIRLNPDYKFAAFVFAPLPTDLTGSSSEKKAS